MKREIFLNSCANVNELEGFVNELESVVNEPDSSFNWSGNEIDSAVNGPDSAFFGLCSSVYSL